LKFTTKKAKGEANHMVATFLTAGQAAEQLNISRWSLRRAVQRGDLSATCRIPGGRLQFAPVAVERYAQLLSSPAIMVRQITTSQRANCVAHGLVPPSPIACPVETDLLDGQPDTTLRGRAEDLALMLGQLPCGLIAVDVNGQVTATNDAAERLGYSAPTANAGPHIGPDHDRACTTALLARALAGETTGLVDSVVWVTEDGRPLTVRIQATPVRDNAGAIIGATALLLDETDAAQVASTRGQRAISQAQTQTNRDLTRSNLGLERFASVASHDLQEPLRKIQAFGDRLKSVDGATLSPAGADYLERMQQAAARMQILINDLLAYYRLSAGPPSVESVDLAAVTRAVLKDLETQVTLSGGRVDVGPLRAIEGDPLRLRQLLQNLISNALKFRSAEVPPVVTVSAVLLTQEDADDAGPAADASTPAWLRLTVQDNGIGFDQKHAERIFEVFKRLHGRSAYEGTGIGLALCRRIAEQHGGHITGTSAPGQGATIQVTLPLRQAQGVGTL
jgi:PAS domain S-box-containing protein